MPCESVEISPMLVSAFFNDSQFMWNEFFGEYLAVQENKIKLLTVIGLRNKHYITIVWAEKVKQSSIPIIAVASSTSHR